MDSVRLKTFNRLGLFSNKISNHYLCEPYSTLQHYKRTFKFLRGVSDGSALLLGSKNQTMINWKEAIRKLDSGNLPRGKVDKVLLTTAPRTYSLVICLDPVLFARHLRNYPLPIVGVATPQEIYEYPEILDVIDYLIPASTRRSDVTIRDLLWNDIVKNTKRTEKGAIPSNKET